VKHGGREDTKRRSRALRKRMSPAERRLWNVLKTSPGGHRFRKQHPCEQFTLDFFCPVRTLVVEVDGESHSRGDRPALDALRDARCAELGFATLRVPAIELLRNLDGVLQHIIAVAESRPSSFDA
jgi:very-short-patch-repair endonuclease